MDERLVHGQVTVGWGSQLRPRRYLVVDDALPETEFQRDLQRLGAPFETQAEFHSVRDARARLAQWSERVESAGVLVFGALLGLLLGKGLALSGLGFLWMSAGCVLLLVGILRGEALRRWAPVLLLLLNAPGLVISPGAVGAG